MPNLDNYVSVAERVTQAQPAIRSVHADAPVMLTDAMGYIRVTVLLKDERSATGTASFRLDLPGRGAQATNPIEDCETSAIGRALAFLGYSSSKGIASQEEVDEAKRRESVGAIRPRASFTPPDTRTPIQPTNGAISRPKLMSKAMDLYNEAKANGIKYRGKMFKDMSEDELSAAIANLTAQLAELAPAGAVEEEEERLF